MKPVNTQHPCRGTCLGLLLVLLLCGCGPGEDAGAALEAYRAAVAEALDVDVEALPAYRELALRYPQRSARMAPVSEVTVGLRSFWSFEHCDLRAVIAARNTVPGRVPSAVLRLPYDHGLLVALRGCSATAGPGEISPEFRRVLDDVLARKLAERDAAFWNGTFGSPEFVALFSPSAPRVRLSEKGVYVPLTELRLLRQLHTVFGLPDVVLDSARLAAAFQGLERSEFGGRVIRSLDEANFYLADVVRLLDARADGKALCPMRVPTRRARELDRALRRYHLRAIQPHLATLGRRARPWLEDLSALAADQLHVMPAGFAAFYERYVDVDAPQGIWQEHLALLRTHASRWSMLLDHCGIPLRP